MRQNEKNLAPLSPESGARI
nr:hypothetical protein [Porphyromonas gulae]